MPNAAYEVTSLSSKGQIVIPNDMRKELGIAAGAKMIIFSYKGDLILRQIQKPKIEEFKELIKKSRAVVKRQGIKQSDLNAIIKKVRNENRP